MNPLKSFPPELICSDKGDMKLCGNEFLVRCPYDQSHRVLNHRFSQHLRRCRTNFELQKHSEGQFPSMLCCRYNRHHRMYGPELLYHEHSCRAQKFPVSWQEKIYFENKTLLEAICDLDKLPKKESVLKPAGMCGVVLGKEKKSTPNQEEEDPEKVKCAKIIADLQAQGVIGASELIELGITQSELDILTHRLIEMVKARPQRPVPEGDVLWADPEEIEIFFFKTNKQKESLHLISQTMDTDSFGYNHYQPRAHWRNRRPSLKAPVPEEKTDNNDDDDNWDLDKNNGPGFDWLRHQYRMSMKGQSRLLPPGMTRAQRKQHVAVNTERLKYEEGIFFEEHETIVPVTKKEPERGRRNEKRA